MLPIIFLIPHFPRSPPPHSRFTFCSLPLPLHKDASAPHHVPVRRSQRSILSSTRHCEPQHQLPFAFHYPSQISSPPKNFFLDPFTHPQMSLSYPTSSPLPIQPVITQENSPFLYSLFFPTSRPYTTPSPRPLFGSFGTPEWCIFIP